MCAYDSFKEKQVSQMLVYIDCRDSNTSTVYFCELTDI